MWRTVVYGLWLGLLWMGCTHERVEPLCPEPVVQADLDEGGTGAPLAYETGFLPLLASQALRRELWTFYGEVEPVARRFAPWGWTDIRLVGREMRARTLAGQRVEARIGCRILNVMAGLGMPDSYRVG